MNNNYAMTVSDLLTDSFKKYNLRLYSGSKGLQNKISRVTVMEAFDSPSYYGGGEFVLTMLYAIKDDVEAQRRLIPELASKNVAVLCVKINRYMDSLPDFFYEDSEKYGVPILLLPRDANFRDLIYDIYNYMFFNNKTYYYLKDLFSGESNDLRVFQEFKMDLKKLIIWLTDGQSISFQYRAFPNQLLIKLDNYLVGVLNCHKTPSRKEIINSIISVLPASIEDNIIIGKAIEDGAAVRKMYQNLKAGYDVVKTFNKEERFYFADDYEVEILLLSNVINDPSNFPDIVNKYVKPLLDYDLLYNNELIKTLNTYYQFSNVSDTAKYLNIHENTLRYRLKLIGNILDLNTRNIKDNLKLFIALTYYNSFGIKN